MDMRGTNVIISTDSCNRGPYHIGLFRSERRQYGRRGEHTGRSGFKSVGVRGKEIALEYVAKAKQQLRIDTRTVEYLIYVSAVAIELAR